MMSETKTLIKIAIIVAIILATVKYTGSLPDEKVQLLTFNLSRDIRINSLDFSNYNVASCSSYQDLLKIAKGKQIYYTVDSSGIYFYAFVNGTIVQYTYSAPTFYDVCSIKSNYIVLKKDTIQIVFLYIAVVSIALLVLAEF